MTSRGIRNHNPGNIERGASWRGLMAPEKMTPVQAKETRFCVFQAPEYGIRAIARILTTYQDKYGLKTVRQILNRWAPPHENDTGSYVRQVSKAIGVDPDDPIDIHDAETVAALVTAIIRHENGNQPYPQELIEKGVFMAGAVKKRPII